MGTTPPSPPGSAPPNAETGSSGKNAFDIFYHLIQRPLSLFALASLVIILFAVIWAFVQNAAEPGTELSFLWIRYTKGKPTTSDYQLLNTRRQPTGANSHQTLRVCGSDTIGSDLMPMIAIGFLSRQGFGTASQAKEGGGTVVTAQKGTERLTVDITADGTKSGIDSLIAGKCDIAMASREPNSVEDETLQAAAKNSGVIGGYNRQIIAKDGIAVIVNRANRLESISYPMLSKIFSGEVKDWNSVTSFQSGEIRLILLNKRSGTRAEFEKRVLSPLGQELSRSVKFESESNIEVSNTVSEQETAIGIVAFPYVGNARSLQLSENSDDKVKALYPSPQSIGDHSYLLNRNLLLIATKDSPLVKNFIDFARNDEGQQVVVRAGFVAYKSRVRQQGAEDEYARTIKSADSQLMNVRFSTGVSNPTIESLKELEAQIHDLRDFLEGGRQIFLLGFTDDTGVDAQNLDLSRKRAERIKTLLLGYPEIQASMNKPQDPNRPGRIIVVGFGSLRPIASNKSDANKARNRRVEIWVK
jgi:phosphate transport system substrate-binding protein